MVSRRRVVFAGVFSLLVPGAGHVYLRSWIRAVAWFSIAVATIAFVLPEAAQTGLQSAGVEELLERSVALPFRVHFALFVVSVLSAVDAVVQVLRGERRRLADGSAGANCPHCGGELDAELDFCPWCSSRLDNNPDQDVER